ncbi:MAG: arginine deiminase [Marinilabiliales bacterium]|nr:MAG: arginine deiminase [Marinilabiliales bacterium]
MGSRIEPNVSSEIGQLEAVIIHPPGPEVENMTPGNAERALYSDILNLSVAQREFSELEQVLRKYTHVFRVKELLEETLAIDEARKSLTGKIFEAGEDTELREYLGKADNRDLAGLLIEGVVMQKNTLTRFRSKERYSLPPLHNFFFARDAAITLPGSVFISSMANRIRERETLIMDSIFNFNEHFRTQTIKMNGKPATTIEGGDVLVAREDILLVGLGARTSSQGIDCLIDMIRSQENGKKYVIVQELPVRPESFIHLDMVFTLLDRDCCMVYEPVIYRTSNYQTVIITIENNRVSSIKEERNIPEALCSLGMDLKPVYCGGRTDDWIQEREQWHSGANFFALAPGKIIGYARNSYTNDELSKNGFEIVTASDIISGKECINDYKKVLVTLDGSELPRGGGGPRCMTMPVKRKPVNW